MENEDKCIALASHAIGLDDGKPYKRHGRMFYKSHRNYYDANIEDCEFWNTLVSKGYAKAGRRDRYGGRMYRLTRSGLDWLGEKVDIQIHGEYE